MRAGTEVGEGTDPDPILQDALDDLRGQHLYVVAQDAARDPRHGAEDAVLADARASIEEGIGLNDGVLADLDIYFYIRGSRVFNRDAGEHQVHQDALAQDG